MTNRYIFDAHISERKFKQVLKMFCTDIPALSASKLLGLNRNTGQRFYELLRKRTVALAIEEARPFTGEVEIDESYFGPRRVRGRRGRGAARKTPVIGLLKRGGKVFTGVVKNCSRAELEPIIKGQALSKTTVYTDGWLGYDGLVLGGDKHRRIYHHDNEFARGKNHVNGIESFWSYAKFRFIKLRGVRPEFFFLARNKAGLARLNRTAFRGSFERCLTGQRSRLSPPPADRLSAASGKLPDPPRSGSPQSADLRPRERECFVEL